MTNFKPGVVRGPCKGLVYPLRGMSDVHQCRDDSPSSCLQVTTPTSCLLDPSGEGDS